MVESGVVEPSYGAQTPISVVPAFANPKLQFRTPQSLLAVTARQSLTHLFCRQLWSTLQSKSPAQADPSIPTPADTPHSVSGPTLFIITQ